MSVGPTRRQPLGPHAAALNAQPRKRVFDDWLGSERATCLYTLYLDTPLKNTYSVMYQA